MRRFLFPIALTIIVTSTIPPQVQAQPGGRQPLLPTPRMLNRYGLELAWWNRAVLDPSRDEIAHLTADEEVVFVQSTAGTVTAFDADNGIKLWAVQLGYRDAPSYPITTNAKLALVTTGSYVFAVDKWKGDLLWQIRLPSQPSTSPTLDDRRMYIGMLDGTMYAYNLRTILQLFEDAKLPEWSYQTIEWNFRTDGAVATPGVPIEPALFFASEDRSLYAVTTNDRALKFQLETDATITARLAHANGLLYLASEDFNVYAVDEVTGQIRWRFVAGLPIRKPPVAIKNDLFIAPERTGVYLLDAVTGRQRPNGFWPRLDKFVAATENLYIMADRTGNVVIVNRETLGVEGVLPLKNYDNIIYNDRTDRLIMATSRGLVAVVKEIGSEFPTYFQSPEKQPILPLLAPEIEPEPEPGDVTDN